MRPRRTVLCEEDSTMSPRSSAEQPPRASSARRRPHLAAAAPLSLILLALALLAACATGSVTTAAFGAYVSGQRIYDRAGILTSTERADLEARAAAVQRAGAPVVVYLRVRDATYDQTLQDATDLMNAWDVQSAPGARDGLVIFFNLTPGDTRHGQVALYAGQKQVDGGRLPQRELQRIYQQVMLPSLAAGRTAQGIAAGLDAARSDLVNGPLPAPPPTAAQRLAAFIALVPLHVLAVLGVLWVALLAWRTRRRRPALPAGVAAATPPSDLAPALVGALVAGRVGDGQLVATMLDLARRGVLAIEPAGKRRAQVRLLDRSPHLTGYEESVYGAVSASAGADGVVPQRALGAIRSRWGPARDELRRDLLGRGWYDATAGARRRPLYLAGIVTLLLALAGYVDTGIGQVAWGAIGASLLLAASMSAFAAAYAIRDTSAAGEEVAAPWRGYLQAVKAARRDLAVGADLAALLDAAVPYAVAAGTIGALNRQLKAAGAQGYNPAWLGRAAGAGAYGDFYPVWVAFSSSVTPSSSGSGGGAAAGGAGAGGGF
jgi:uncharacterized membrane protein YgcG